MSNDDEIDDLMDRLEKAVQPGPTEDRPWFDENEVFHSAEALESYCAVWGDPFGREVNRLEVRDQFGKVRRVTVLRAMSQWTVVVDEHQPKLKFRTKTEAALHAAYLVKTIRNPHA